MKIKALMLVAAFAIPTIASADDTKKADTTEKSKESTKLEVDDVKIVVHQHHVNMMEIDLGKMAQKLGSAKVKAFGGTLVKDHTAANKELKAMAKKKGIAKIPAYVPEADADKMEHDNVMAEMTRIKALKGAEFDKEFLTMIVADHDKLIAKTETQITAAKDPDLATFLRNVKPTLQSHADTARELQKETAVSVK